MSFAVDKGPIVKQILHGARAAESRCQTDFVPIAVDKENHAKNDITGGVGRGSPMSNRLPRYLPPRKNPKASFVLQGAQAAERRCQPNYQLQPMRGCMARTILQGAFGRGTPMSSRHPCHMPSMKASQRKRDIAKNCGHGSPMSNRFRVNCRRQDAPTSERYCRHHCGKRGATGSLGRGAPMSNRLSRQLPSIRCPMILQMLQGAWAAERRCHTDFRSNCRRYGARW